MLPNTKTLCSWAATLTETQQDSFCFEDRLLTLRVDEVHHIAISLEEVDLLYPGYRIHSEAFQRALQSLVICRGCLVDSLLLSAEAKGL